MGSTQAVNRNLPLNANIIQQQHQPQSISHNRQSITLSQHQPHVSQSLGQMIVQGGQGGQLFQQQQQQFISNSNQSQRVIVNSQQQQQQILNNNRVQQQQHLRY